MDGSMCTCPLNATIPASSGRRTLTHVLCCLEVCLSFSFFSFFFLRLRLARSHAQHAQHARQVCVLCALSTCAGSSCGEKSSATLGR